MPFKGVKFQLPGLHSGGAKLFLDLDLQGVAHRKASISHCGRISYFFECTRSAHDP
jgi:hypothetical protein